MRKCIECNLNYFKQAGGDAFKGYINWTGGHFPLYILDFFSSCMAAVSLKPITLLAPFRCWRAQHGLQSRKRHDHEPRRTRRRPNVRRGSSSQSASIFPARRKWRYETRWRADGRRRRAWRPERRRRRVLQLLHAEQHQHRFQWQQHDEPGRLR